MRRLVLLLLPSFLLLTFTGPAATAEEPAKPGAEAEAEPGGKPEAGLDLTFPDVEGWQHTEKRPLAHEDGGYTVGYNATGAAVTVYVFNRRMADIPDDPASEPVRAEMASAKDALRAAKRRGLYETVEEQEAGEKRLGGKDGRPALYARYRLGMEGQAAESEIYVLVYRDHFIKVRTTWPADVYGVDKIDSLYAALAKMMAD